MAVMKEVPRLVPDEIAAYHTSRARCQLERKKASRKRERLAKVAGDADMAVDATSGPAEEVVTSLENPVKPEILDHMVLGINETIKSLETAIDDLKLRLLMIADRLNGIHIKPNSDLLPTAPHPERSPSPAPTLSESSPPAFIIIPLQSISPQTLVSPIPQYCATYNSLVWQWGQMSRVAKTRIKERQLREVIGEEREEVRVVPLGRVEGEMAALVGLRRLACLAIRVSSTCTFRGTQANVKRSHPQIQLLEKILPKSVLHPPRHALTLPYPTSNLKVHTNDITDGSVPLPHVHYAPVTIKGITTSTPVDANSKKKIRLAEVRQKRVEAKLKRKLEIEGGGKTKTSLSRK